MLLCSTLSLCWMESQIGPFFANCFLLLFLEHNWGTLWEPIGKLKQPHENTIKPFENLVGTPKSKIKKNKKNQLWNCP